MSRPPVLGILLLALAAPLILACTDQTGASGPDLVSVGFSRDGSGCSLGDDASSFEAGVAIHTVLTMEPALPTGGTVKVTLEKDGTELVEAGKTITMTEPAPCVWGTLPDLEPGHYRMSYTISPSLMPPATGEFDVTPAKSAETPAPSTSGAPTPASDTPLAARILDRLDALAALALEEDELLTAEWAIEESEWATENMTALIRGGSLERYVDELIALTEIVGAGGDQTTAIDSLLRLRDEIATEFALPTLGPSSAPPS
jgi:hypothetical protein